MGSGRCCVLAAPRAGISLVGELQPGAPVAALPLKGGWLAPCQASGRGVSLAPPGTGCLPPSGQRLSQHHPAEPWEEAAQPGWLLAPARAIPVLGLDVHLQAVAARRPVPALLADKQLLPPVLEGLVQAELCPGQEALGAGRALQGHSRAQGEAAATTARPERGDSLAKEKPCQHLGLSAKTQQGLFPHPKNISKTAAPYLPALLSQTSRTTGTLLQAIPPKPRRRSPYRVGLRRAVQLYHVALQVLLLHELLGAGGALQGRTGPSAPSAPQPISVRGDHQQHNRGSGLRASLEQEELPPGSTGQLRDGLPGPAHPALCRGEPGCPSPSMPAAARRCC